MVRILHSAVYYAYTCSASPAHFLQSRVLEMLDIEEKKASYLEQRYGNVTVLSTHMTTLRHKEKVTTLVHAQCVYRHIMHIHKLCPPPPILNR